jgi:hypothetical protein
MTAVREAAAVRSNRSNAGDRPIPEKRVRRQRAFGDAKADIED